VKRATKKILTVTVFLALVAAQGCRRSEVSGGSARASDTASPTDKAAGVEGCHAGGPLSSPAPVESPAETPPSSAAGVESNDMVLIKGGEFEMGSGRGLAVEGPPHKVAVKSFWADAHEVTVAQFTEFVKATGYETESERAGWSGVFNMRTGRWEKTDGADWRHPEGPSSSAPVYEPVTQITWNDANAYAKWADKRLPTEAEFEYAARGGLAGKEYAWGDELNPQGHYLANWWQGVFPSRDLGEDGFTGRAPVGSFPPNGYGLYDLTGNVWEWCEDWFAEGYYSASPRLNPRGPRAGEDRVIRGGSWLCSDNYCAGYRVAARNHTAPDTGLNNLGFRCVRDE
jgi:sulfatase modifying factor 1